MVLSLVPKHKKSVHSRKRAGLHHKHTKHYGKTYWPYLPMLLIVVTGLIINTTWHTGKGVLGYATDVSPTTLLQDTNAQRTDNGLAALALNDKLTAAAQAKADNMTQLDYWSHVSPSGEQPWQFITAAGYVYVTAGENLAYGFNTGDAVIAGWMASPEHRANILNTTYQDIGFGIANSPNYQGSGEETVIVAMYAEPRPAVAPAPAKATAKPIVPASQPTAQAQPQPAATPSSTPQQSATAPTQTTPIATTANQKQASEQKMNNLASHPVSRIDVLTDGNAQWSALALSVLASISMFWFVLKHARLWRRYLVRGEAFVIKHPVLDSTLLAIAVIGLLLTRISGFVV